MRTADPIRIYFANGLVERFCKRAFWPLFFVRLVTDLDLSPFQLVALGTVFELSILLAEIPTGVVADLYSRRLSVILSYLISGVGILASAIVEPYWSLVFAQVLIGVGSTFSSGAETAWVSDEVGDLTRVEALILRRGQWQMVAGIAGVALFALVAWSLTLTTALVLVGVFYLGWGLVLAVVMPENNFERAPGQGWADFMAMLSRGWTEVRSTWLLWILAVVVFVGGLAKEAIDRLDVARLDQVGLPQDMDEALIIGVIVAVKMALAAVLLGVARRRAVGRGVVVAMVALMAGTAAGILVLAHADLLWLAAVGLVIQGGFQFATIPLVAAWTNTFASSTARATVHSFMGQGESFGEILGGLALGAVAQWWSISFAMTISAALFAIAAATAFMASTRWA